jgi:hypothetical protein
VSNSLLVVSADVRHLQSSAATAVLSSFVCCYLWLLLLLLWICNPCWQVAQRSLEVAQQRLQVLESDVKTLALVDEQMAAFMTDMERDVK